MMMMKVIQFVFIYVLSQELQGQLQTQHRVDTNNINNKIKISVHLPFSMNSRLQHNLLNSH
jgi:hypothetical protein